jgi:hypothetical protein
MQRRDRNLWAVSDLHDKRPRRLPKLMHPDDGRRFNWDTVSQKVRLVTFSNVC